MCFVHLPPLNTLFLGDYADKNVLWLNDRECTWHAS